MRSQASQRRGSEIRAGRVVSDHDRERADLSASRCGELVDRPVAGTVDGRDDGAVFAHPKVGESELVGEVKQYVAMGDDFGACCPAVLDDDRDARSLGSRPKRVRLTRPSSVTPGVTPGWPRRTAVYHVFRGRRAVGAESLPFRFCIELMCSASAVSVRDCRSRCDHGCYRQPLRINVASRALVGQQRRDAIRGNPVRAPVGPTMTPRVAEIGHLTAQGRATWEAIAQLAERVPIDERWSSLEHNVLDLGAMPDAAVGDEVPPIGGDDRRRITERAASFGCSDVDAVWPCPAGIDRRAPGG